MKICSKCHIEKDISEFREKKERYKNSIYLVRDSICNTCAKVLAKEHYHKKMSDPKNRERHNELAKLQYWKRRDKNIAQSKVYRSKPEYKENRKKYIEKNKEKIYKQEVVTKKKYSEKHKKGLTDKYISRLLVTQNKPVTEDSIENKKVEVLISRLKLAVSNTYRGDKKICVKCGIEKDVSEFWFDSIKDNKRLATCKSCRKNKLKKKR